MKQTVKLTVTRSTVDNDEEAPSNELQISHTREKNDLEGNDTQWLRGEEGHEVGDTLIGHSVSHCEEFTTHIVQPQDLKFSRK